MAELVLWPKRPVPISPGGALVTFTGSFEMRTEEPPHFYGLIHEMWAFLISFIEHI